MSEHGTTHEVTRAGDGALAQRFDDPGLPPHVPRLADEDPKAAARAEKQVVVLFGISIVGTLAFLVAYFAVDQRSTVFFPGIGTTNAQHLALGAGMALSLLGIGLGAVHWAKTLMPDHEVVEERHPLRSADEDRAHAVETILDGGEAAQLPRRNLIKYSLGSALGLFALPFVLQVAGSLGPLPGDELSRTIWDPATEGDHAGKPIRLMRDPQMTPIKASDVTIGSVFHVLPESMTWLEEDNVKAGRAEWKGVMEQKAKAAVILMRLDPKDFVSTKARDWGHEGIVAYSKICTHVGCPVGLYEQKTRQLLCPCHQSTFDVPNDCEVVFGPAKRALPQLKITVDDEGYLIAKEGFKEPVGPSFWERG
jgi:ubiquinol-cytochrome c reductase iron-sulfur subunit